MLANALPARIDDDLCRGISAAGPCFSCFSTFSLAHSLVYMPANRAGGVFASLIWPFMREGRRKVFTSCPLHRVMMSTCLTIKGVQNLECKISYTVS